MIAKRTCECSWYCQQPLLLWFWHFLCLLSFTHLVEMMFEFLENQKNKGLIVDKKKNSINSLKILFQTHFERKTETVIQNYFFSDLGNKMAELPGEEKTVPKDDQIATTQSDGTNESSKSLLEESLRGFIAKFSSPNSSPNQRANSRSNTISKNQVRVTQASGV